MADKKLNSEEELEIYNSGMEQIVYDIGSEINDKTVTRAFKSKYLLNDNREYFLYTKIHCNIDEDTKTITIRDIEKFQSKD
jgi:hypothetical protein